MSSKYREFPTEKSPGVKALKFFEPNQDIINSIIISIITFALNQYANLTPVLALVFSLIITTLTMKVSKCTLDYLSQKYSGHYKSTEQLIHEYKN